MRVLSVQHYPTFGGPTNEIITLDGPLKRLGIETVVAITDEPGDALPVLLASPVPTYPIQLGRLRMSGKYGERLAGIRSAPRDVHALRQLIRTLRPDLVKVHGPHNPQGAVAARKEGVPCVWVVSSTRVPASLRPVGAALVVAEADAILVNGKALVRAYPLLRLARARTFAYYPPVDVERFKPLAHGSKVRFRQEVGIPDGSPVVVSVANVTPQKGLELFVDTAARIARETPAHFVVVGAIADAHRNYFAELRSQVDRLGLTARFHWLGARRDVECVVGAADVKLITSRPASEGTTTTAGEAMACEVPVITTNVGAVSEVVVHGESGFLVTPDDSEALATVTIRLLAQPELRGRMGRSGRDRVASRFTAETCARRHIAAYETALRSAQDAARPR